VITELLEGILGNVGRSGGGDGVGLFGETRETFIGGCWGFLMSGFFVFFFFFTLIAWIAGINNFAFQITGTAAPIVMLLCVSSLLSPLIGALFGAQGGKYSVTRHVGCFVIYLAALLGGIYLLSTFVA
jgi:hypothetical protein